MKDVILYSDNQVIAFNKPSGLPVQPDKTGDESLMDWACRYCKHPVHLVHRIDRPVSGVVVFAKNKRAATDVQRQFQGGITKVYFALVKNKPSKDHDTIEHYLEKNPVKNRAFAYEVKQANRKYAKLTYDVVASSTTYHLLKIYDITGRHHQIRSQLSAIGSPIKGDVKYGFRRGNKDRSIHLHAAHIIVKHPVSKETINIKAPFPKEVIWDTFNINELL